jgi:hypothetical protein
MYGSSVFGLRGLGFLTPQLRAEQSVRRDILLYHRQISDQIRAATMTLTIRVKLYFINAEN